MNLRQIDLNLLVVFNAVMDERSVTRAAQKMAMSQPAMSHALRRLRDMLKDELFVRTPDGMTPTPRAQQLAPAISRILNDMRYALEPDTFTPAESTHRFTLAINNYAAVVLGPAICCAVTAAAPGVRLELKPSGVSSVADRLDRGEVDLAIGNTPESADRFMRRTLCDDSFVLLMRPGHAAAGATITPELIAEIPHLGISSSGEDTGFVDLWLAKHNLARRIPVSVPYLSSLDILERTGLVAIMSRRMATEFACEGRLCVRDFPFATPTVTQSMAWHRRLNDQPAHRWLRDTIVAAIKNKATEPRRSSEPAEAAQRS